MRDVVRRSARISHPILSPVGRAFHCQVVSDPTVTYMSLCIYRQTQPLVHILAHSTGMCTHMYSSMCSYVHVIHEGGWEG